MKSDVDLTSENNNKCNRSLDYIANSLTDFASGIQGGKFSYQVTKLDSLFLNNRYNLISNNRDLLSETYTEMGVVQSLIDLPVDDGLRKGVNIHSIQLGDDIPKLENYIDEDNTIEKVAQTNKWGRLFGGSALIILTDQDPATPLNIEVIKKFSRLDFKPVDLWEIYPERAYTQQTLDDKINWFNSEFFYYYGIKIHTSRVILFRGKEAPSLVRYRLRGWGMSEVERVIIPLNQYLKGQNTIFELLDEAKIDIFKMKGFNTSLISQNGTQTIQQRVQLVNMIKNQLNSILMDSEDDYEQKVQTFTGLADMMNQIRIQIASALKMPMTKLFGLSATGFSSGEDDIENYNVMVESEVRNKIKYMIVTVLKLISKKLFGYIPDDLSISFEPLRVMSSEQEEIIKDSQFRRIMELNLSRILSDKEVKKAVDKNNLLPIKIGEN